MLFLKLFDLMQCNNSFAMSQLNMKGNKNTGKCGELVPFPSFEKLETSTSLENSARISSCPR
jgi:hypothetical protein